MYKIFSLCHPLINIINNCNILSLDKVSIDTSTNEEKSHPHKIVAIILKKKFHRTKLKLKWCGPLRHSDLHHDMSVAFSSKFLSYCYASGTQIFISKYSKMMVRHPFCWIINKTSSTQVGMKSGCIPWLQIITYTTSIISSFCPRRHPFLQVLSSLLWLKHVCRSENIHTHTTVQVQILKYVHSLLFLCFK